MAWRKTLKASRPAPIKHSFASFAGELCPACRENRLVGALEYPICTQCRKKYGITEKELKKLADHRLLISEEEIDWTQLPHPLVTGTIDRVPWKANFALGKWLVEILEPVKERGIICKLIRTILDDRSPDWIERARNKKTKIRRYYFFVAIGATIVTAAYFIQKHAERLKREKEEADEAEN